MTCDTCGMNIAACRCDSSDSLIPSNRPASSQGGTFSDNPFFQNPHVCDIYAGWHSPTEKCAIRLQDGSVVRWKQENIETQIERELTNFKQSIEDLSVQDHVNLILLHLKSAREHIDDHLLSQFHECLTHDLNNIALHATEIQRRWTPTWEAKP